MGWFIFIALLGIATVVTLGGLWVSGAEATEGDNYGRGASKGFNPKKWMVLTVVGSVAVFFLVTGFCMTDQVDTGHIGIKKQFGAVTGEPTGDSLVFHAPWQSIDQVSVQNEKRTFKMGDTGIQTGNNKVDITGGAAVSKDSQQISLFVQVNYRLDKDKAVQLYRETGGQYIPRVLDNAVFQETKAQTAKYSATEFAANRETIRQNIENALGDAVKPQGISILGVSLLDVGYSPGLTAAIERTVEANQKAKAAEAQVKVVEAQARQRIAQANGLATAVVTEARAKAKAQHLQQKTLTPLLVQQNAIDKLNPNVQVIVCPSHTSCVPQAVLQTANAGK